MLEGFCQRQNQKDDRSEDQYYYESDDSEMIAVDVQQ